MSKRVGVQTVPDALAAIVFYLLVGMFVASSVSVVRRHIALPFFSSTLGYAAVVLSLVVLNNPLLQRTHQTYDLFWRDISLLGGLLLLKSNIVEKEEDKKIQ